jgi:DNA-directed RNA polymerase specialized sigma24 family protein
MARNLLRDHWRRQKVRHIVQPASATDPEPAFGHDYSNRTYTGWSPQAIARR